MSEKDPFWPPTPLFQVAIGAIALVVLLAWVALSIAVWRQCRAEGHTFLYCLGVLT